MKSKIPILYEVGCNNKKTKNMTNNDTSYIILSRRTEIKVNITKLGVKKYYIIKTRIKH